MSDLDIAAVVTYERNAWGQNSGDVVQPADVVQQVLGLPVVLDPIVVEDVVHPPPEEPDDVADDEGDDTENDE